MSSRICIEGDKSMFQSSGKRFSSPLVVTIDDCTVVSIGYNRIKKLEVPAGEHSIRLQIGAGGSTFIRKYGCEPLKMLTAEGETANIVLYADMEARKVYIADRRDKASASRYKRLARFGKARQLAVGMIFLIGVYNLILGLLVLFSDYFSELGINGILAAFFGLGFIGLGIAANRKSDIALLIATAIYGIDGYVTLRTLLSAALSGDQGTLYGLSACFHAAFLLILLGGVLSGFVYRRTLKGIKAAESKL